MKLKKVNFFIFFLIFFLFFNNSPLQAKDNIEIAGDILELTLPTTAFGMSLIFHDDNGTKQFVKSFITTLGITYTLKYTIHKKRPNGGEHSFPSGHTSSSFSAASFIQRRYGWKYGIPAYIAASFVGWSRIECKAHYPEDVLAGAFIGIVSTYMFTKKFHNKILKNINFSIISYKNSQLYAFFLQTSF